MKKVLEVAAGMVGSHLLDYASEIEDAYLNADDKFKVNLGVEISPKGSGHRLKTSISFTALKIKDGADQVVSEKQDPLFERADTFSNKIGQRKGPAQKTRGMTEGARRRMRWYQHH